MRRRLFAIGLISMLLVARWDIPRVQAAVAYDSSSGLGWDDVSGTFAHTVGSLTNGILLVWTSCGAVGDADGVTYGGVSLTDSGIGLAGSNYSTTLWYLKNPTAGTANVVVDTTTINDDCGAISMSFSGVDQTTPFGNSNSASGLSTAPSVTVNSVSADSMVVDFVNFAGAGTRTFTAGTDQTLRQDVICGSGAGDYDCASSHEGPVSAGNITMSYSVSGTLASWEIVAAELKVAGGGGGAVLTPIPAPINISIF